MPGTSDYTLSRQKKGFAFCAVFLSVLCLIGIFTAPAWDDELNFHAPLAASLSWPMITEADSDYSSAYPPLPYVSGAWLARQVSGLWALRLSNLLIALLTAVAFWRLARSLSPIYPALTLAFIANPYFLRSACFYFMFNWGLLFAFAAAAVLLRPGVAGWKYWLGHVCIGLAVLSMQWMLVLAFAVAVVEGKQICRQPLAIKPLVRWLAANLLPLLPAAWLFYRWQGLVHPNFAYHALQPSAFNATMILAVAGFLFWPWLISNFPRLSWPTVRLALFLLPLLALSLPQYSTRQLPGFFAGLESTFLHVLERLSGIPYAVGLLVLAVAGILIIKAMWQKIRVGNLEVILLTCILWLAALLSSAVLSSSHIYQLLPWLLLLLADNLDRDRPALLRLNIAFFLLSLGYLAYLIFAKSHGFLL